MPGPRDDDFDDDEPTVGGSARRPLRKEEFPDEVDEDWDSDDAGEETEPCPYCGAEIYASGEWCPKCGKYLVENDARTKESRGWQAVVLWVVLAGMLFGAVLLLR